MGIYLGPCCLFMEELGFIDRCMKILTAPAEFFKAPLDKNLVPAAIHFAIITALSLLIATVSGIVGSFIGAFFGAIVGIVSGGDVGAAIMAALVNLFTSLIGSLIMIPVSIFMIPAAIVLAAISALVTHAFLYLMGARGGWERTVKTFYYISTFSLVVSALNIIPFLGPILGLIVGLYVLYVTIQAYSLQHKISMLNSAIAVIAPAAIMLVFILIIVLFFVILGGGIAALTALPLMNQ